MGYASSERVYKERHTGAGGFHGTNDAGEVGGPEPVRDAETVSDLITNRTDNTRVTEVNR